MADLCVGTAGNARGGEDHTLAEEKTYSPAPLTVSEKAAYHIFTFESVLLVKAALITILNFMGLYQL